MANHLRRKRATVPVVVVAVHPRMIALMLGETVRESAAATRAVLTAKCFIKAVLHSILETTGMLVIVQCHLPLVGLAGGAAQLVLLWVDPWAAVLVALVEVDGPIEAQCRPCLCRCPCRCPWPGTGRILHDADRHHLAAAAAGAPRMPTDRPTVVDGQLAVAQLRVATTTTDAALTVLRTVLYGVIVRRRGPANHPPWLVLERPPEVRGTDQDKCSGAVRTRPFTANPLLMETRSMPVQVEQRAIVVDPPRHRDLLTEAPAHLDLRPEAMAPVHQAGRWGMDQPAHHELKLATVVVAVPSTHGPNLQLINSIR